MAEWKDVGVKIAQAAPLLGSLFGPVGTGIGVGIKLLASAFGLKEEEITPEKIDEIITQDPQALLKLKEIEQENRSSLLNHQLRMEELRLSDVANARMLSIETVKATGKRDYNLYILSYWCILAPVGLLVALIYYGLPKMASEVALLVGGFIGIIIGEYKTVTGFFFGSSKGSSDKSKLIEDLQKGNGK